MPGRLVSTAGRDASQKAQPIGPERSPEESPDDPASGTWAVPRGRILLVDDEPTLVRSLQRTLTQEDFRVETAGSAKEALELVNDIEFDAVISDISMPGMDGLALLRELQARAPALPVILITASPEISTAMKAVEDGAFHYLTKPLDLEKLHGALDRAICLHQVAKIRGLSAGGVDRASLLPGAVLDAKSFRLALNSLWMAYQPIVDVASRRVFAYEALMRCHEPSWAHPGMILDAAERFGELERLGRRTRELAAVTVREAADTTGGTNKSGESGGSSEALLFVNLHSADLVDSELFAATTSLGRIAHRVVLEITERCELTAVPELENRMRALRDLGYRIAVDDLGAGYSSLTSLALVEPEFVKLDMGLTRGVDSCGTRQKLIRSMTALCHDTGRLVIAEGIETIEERDALIEIGCDYLQGYLLARPGVAFPQSAGPSGYGA